VHGRAREPLEKWVNPNDTGVLLEDSAAPFVSVLAEHGGSDCPIGPRTGPKAAQLETCRPRAALLDG